MKPDTELLHRYAQAGCEEDFAELVRRHVNFVYSAALRQVNGDAYLAQDVAQTVFADLARNARSLARRESVAGWLYTSTHFAASKFVRTETRRRNREEKFMREPVAETAPETDWREIRPVLDDAMHELKDTDREALLLRFFENRPLAEVGVKLRLNENAARMRVERALVKLRVVFARRGITTTATLASVISVNAVQMAPANLASTLTAASVATAGTGTFTLLKIMTATQLKLGIGALVVAGVATTLVVQHQTQTRLREENESLRQRITQLQTDNLGLARREAVARLMLRLPAPHLQVPSQSNGLPTDELQFTNLYSRFTNGAPKLTAAQVETYLKANRTNAASLLAAYRTSGDEALIREAMEKYPNDPQVAFEAVLDKNLSPEELRQWLDTFKQSAPDNALANYLSAFNYFGSGQTDQGIRELTAASGKGFNDFTISRIQDDGEAYLSAGYSTAEAEVIASMQVMLPQLSEVKKAARDLIALANAYGQSGDQASAQAALQMAINMGQTLQGASSSSPALISQLTGMSIETLALNAMDPNSLYGGNGQTAQDRINQIRQQRATITELVQQAEPWYQTMSDQDLLNYENRRMLFGEVAALQWVADKFGRQ